MGLPFDFAFEGFRLIRERPKLVVLWGAVSLFGYGLCVLILVALLGPLQQSFINLGPRPTDVTLVEAVLSQAVAGLAACAPVYVITSSVLNSAICRASLEGGDDRLGYLRFGMQELRVIVLSVVMLGLMLGLFFLVGIPMAAIFPQGMAGAAVGVALAAVTWLRIKLSLNIAQTYATRRIDIFGSFSLTRERFWPLVGGYLMAFGLFIIVGYLCEQPIEAIIAIAFGEAKASATPDYSSLSAFLTPSRITATVLWLGLATPQLTAILNAAPVAAYRALSGMPGPSVAESVSR